MKSFHDLIVTVEMNLREALERLNETSEKILMLVDDEGYLLRMVSDGDIRRLLLKGAGLETRLVELGPRQPATVTELVDVSTALDQMNQLGLDHLPVVDEMNRPVELISRREIDKRVYLSQPHLGNFEHQFVEEAFQTNWVAPLGPNVDAFEQELAALIGVRSAAALSSGTAAIHLALRLLGITPNSSVFCSSLTFAGSAFPILYESATPVFIDSESESWNMSPRALEQALAESKRENNLPKAVIVVHLYGQSANLDPLLEICEAYDVPLVEDAAESLGATYKGKQTGAFGKLGIFSFNGNKIITTSGGGMLVSDDQALVQRARYLATQARSDRPYYHHTEVGYNYRMSNILAGIGRGQLRVLEKRVQARRAVFERYRDGLTDIAEIEWMPEPKFSRSTRWLTTFLIRPGAEATPGQLIEYLGRQNLEARHVWKPMHLQPIFSSCRYYPHEQESSFSDAVFARGVCLPSSSSLRPRDQERIINGIRSFFRRSQG